MKILRILACCIAAYAFLVVVLAFLYLAVPPVSTLMLARWASFQSVTYAPVPLSRISPHLLRAVIRAEDSRFCTHHGIDWGSLEDTIEDVVADRRKRGASTIPMQVAKNLFLWPQQSYIRKAIELPMALFLNAVWSKSRMMENYLSVAEWGKGIYGVEAAAQTYFHKPASSLTQEEAALLAAALPNPKNRNPARPSPYHARYAAAIAKSASGSSIACIQKR